MAGDRVPLVVALLQTDEALIPPAALAQRLHHLGGAQERVAQHRVALHAVEHCTPATTSDAARRDDDDDDDDVLSSSTKVYM